MPVLRVTHTADLRAGTRAALRALFDDAFEGDFDDHDFDHALGGLHVTSWEDGAPVAHAAVVQRQVLHGGRALRAGYVEAVAVRADRRRLGYGRALMTEVDRIVRGAYHLGALSAGGPGARLYASCGWQRWEGATRALTPGGVVDAPDEGVHVLVAGVALDTRAPLTCDWREGALW